MNDKLTNKKKSKNAANATNAVVKKSLAENAEMYRKNTR